MRSVITALSSGREKNIGRRGHKLALNLTSICVSTILQNLLDPYRRDVVTRHIELEAEEAKASAKVATVKEAVELMEGELKDLERANSARWEAVKRRTRDMENMKVVYIQHIVLLRNS